MPVTLSTAKGLARRTERSFAALRMTAWGCVILSAAKDLWWTYGESPGALYYRITIYEPFEGK